MPLDNYEFDRIIDTLTKTEIDCAPLEKRRFPDPILDAKPAALKFTPTVNVKDPITEGVLGTDSVADLRESARAAFSKMDEAANFEILSQATDIEALTKLAEVSRTDLGTESRKILAKSVPERLNARAMRRRAIYACAAPDRFWSHPDRTAKRVGSYGATEGRLKESG